jgi:hypothetical protein
VDVDGQMGGAQSRKGGGWPSEVVVGVGGVCAGVCACSACARRGGRATDQLLEAWVAVYDAGYDDDVGSAVLDEGETVHGQQYDDRKAPVCLRRTTERVLRLGEVKVKWTSYTRLN